MHQNENTTQGHQTEPLSAATSEYHPMDKYKNTPGEAAALWRSLSLDIGHRYADARIQDMEIYNPNQKTAIETLTEFGQHMPDRIGTGAGLILYGKPGTGKDHILAALLRGAVRSYGFTAAFRDGMALFAETRAAISTNSEEDLRRELCRPQILAISDPIPPVGELTDYQAAFIRDIIDRRYRRCLSTWVTTNIDTREGLIASLTLPVFERLREGATVVFFDWESYRTRSSQP